ncbi:MAG: cupin domain-containing protein [Acidobacteriota bacterium]|nr:cupin domain-containing protein [Acidobacteriota bacterium]
MALAAAEALFAAVPFQAGQSPQPVPKVIKLDAGEQGYQRVLGGPPETSSMRSGLVVLKPGASIGRHNTDQYEELIVVFEGRGEMRITGGPVLKLESGMAAYCPPRTEHDVFNVGTTQLRYLYIVAEEKISGR